MIVRVCVVVFLVTFNGVMADDFSLNLGAVLVPPMTDDDDWLVAPLPSFKYQRGGYSVSSQGLGIGADLLPNPMINLGPLVRYSGGRDEAEVPDIPASAEVGVAVSSGIPWSVIGVPLPGILTAGADVVTTWPGGHESPYAEVKTGWVWPATERLTLVGNLGVSYFGDDYADRFFSLNNAEAGAAGVDAFDAGAGWQDLSVGVVTIYRFKPRWSATLVYNHSRYFGDAANSPVTDLLDDRDRHRVVFSVNYQWLGEGRRR